MLSFLFALAVSLPAVAQNNLNVKGVVTDAEGETLIGVSVLQVGSANGTITDVDGRFTLQVPQGAVLRFSYIGYETIDLPAKSDMNVKLSGSKELLEEVVVVGYGVQKKSVVTAAISSVKAADIEKVVPSRIENVLKGQVSGLQVTTNSGQPGADAKISIRGSSTTTGKNDPLYIVDGMAVDGGIRNLNPADIESVEILKDAASAAVYGSRGGNGVILITTKQGTSLSNKPKINYDVTYGLQNPWRKKSVLNAEEYMVIQNEMHLNADQLPSYSPMDLSNARKGLTPNTDWQNEVFNKNAPVQSHQLSVSGGNAKTAYFFSLGYFGQDGIIGGNYGVSNYDRWTFRANNTYEVYNVEKERDFLNKLKFGSNVTYGRANSIGITTNSEFGSVLGSAITLTPLMNVYASPEEASAIIAAHPYAVTDKQGNVFQTSPAGFQEIVNPLALLNRPNPEYSNEDKFVGNFYAELNVLKGLTFRSSYGFDLAFWGADGYAFPYYLSDITQIPTPAQSHVWSEMHRGFTWQVDNTLTYNFSLDAQNHFTLLAGQESRKSFVRNLRGDDYDLIAYRANMAVINSATSDRKNERTDGNYTQSTLASYFGRIDYNFDERYMIQATLRCDGSDKFGTKNKWATFPSFSAGWNVTNESFIQNILPDWFNFMKLRGGWGINGNQNIDQYLYLSLMDVGQNYYFGGNEASKNMEVGTSGSRVPNMALKWEESKQTDIGVDLRFLKNALSVSVDYFNKQTTGFLREYPTPAYLGLKPPYANAGRMDNKGWEFDLGYQFHINDWQISAKANASYVKNTLIDIGIPDHKDQWGNSGAAGVENFIWASNGMPWPYFYGWRTDGIIQNQAEADEYNFKYNQSAVPGDVRFKDLDNNGTIDDKDREMLGKGAPDWVFGLTLNAAWKGFDFNAFFQGQTGNSIFDISQRADIPGANRPSWILDRWTGEGTSNKIPRVTTKDENHNWRASDLYIKNGSYCRLKEIQIGYTLPKDLTKKVTIERLRFYIGAENLFTFTKYDGFDPEIGDGDQGVDKGIYPQARTINFGASITF